MIAPLPEGRRTAWPLQRWNEFRLAMMLLTRVPVGRMETVTTISRAVWAFPIVGLLVGATIGVVRVGAAAVGFSALVSAMIAVAVGFIATGSLHEDGLADCADGFGGGSTVSRKLEIMRDSRLGTYGVIALILAINLRVAFISELTGALDAVAILAGLGSLTRGLLPVAMLVIPSARSDGLGSELAKDRNTLATGLGVFIAMVSAAILVPGAIWVAPVTIAATALVWWLARSQIGGTTGDVLGASQVAGEIAGLATWSISTTYVHM